MISTLWPVNDDATAILMARFYHNHLTLGLPPAQALHGAQLWLRDSTTTELAAFLTECGIVVTVPEGPDQRPFNEPYFWAAFQFTGA
ncbi:CHAT domain-containing protein [Streptomyces antibioticus]|uniref:CHAT domain-containing protein n=1 Tax=Streptomyces antibioticus TaxID=1890 RepID=UPI003F4B30D5